MKRISIYFSLVALIFSFSATSVMGIVLPCNITHSCVAYVNDVVFSNQTGTVYEPFLSISSAVAYVLGDADYNTIRVAGGTYTTENLPISVNNPGKSIHIQGGYSEDFATLDPGTYVSTVNAGGNAFLSYTNTAGSVRGLKMTNANGSALSVINTGATSYNVDIEDNLFSANFKEGFGGIAALEVSVTGSNTVLVKSNNFTKNNGTFDTVASFAGSGNGLVVTNNSFSKNDNEIIFYCENALVYNNAIVFNNANNVVNTGGGCKFINNLVSDNSSTTSALIMSNNGNDVMNNLITSNSGGSSVVHEGLDTSQFTYNGFFSNASDPSPLPETNFSCDPKYQGDITSLGADSDCIDKGAVSSDVTVDFWGNSRPQDGDGVGGAAYDPGVMEVADLVLPAPVISELSVDNNPFSPNGDNYKDIAKIVFTTSAKAIIKLSFVAGGQEQFLLKNAVFDAYTYIVPWDGSYFDSISNSDVTAPDGVYKFIVVATNSGGTDSKTFDITVDSSVLPPVVDPPVPPVVDPPVPPVIDPPAPGQECAGFTDIAVTHPSCDAVTYVKSIGAMTGNPDGTFAPNNSLQRDQIAKISLETYNLFDSNADYCKGTNPFPDVATAAWSYQYICRGVDLGMITGYKSGTDAGKYIPGRSVNRVEFLALILRNLSEAMPALSSASYDDTLPNQWFSGYAKFSMDNSLFTGSNLFPSSTTTRLEVAEVIFKLHGLGKL